MTAMSCFTRAAGKICALGLIASSLVLLLGCWGIGSQNRTAEDLTYLTPVAPETFQAYQSGTPITNKLQAVIAAQLGLYAPPHFKPLGTPQVISAEELSLQDAHKRVEQPGSTTYDDRPGDTKVWLVVFESDVQVIPPPPDPSRPFTPPAPFHGCSYVIVNADGSDGVEVGGIDCPP